MDKVMDTPRTDVVLKNLQYFDENIQTQLQGLYAHGCNLERELAAAQKKNNLLACALRALLSKCPDCGGTGEVGTGIIQIGQPVQMPCFVCAGERQILLRECGK